MILGLLLFCFEPLVLILGVAHSLRFLQTVRVLICEALITDSERSAQILRLTVIRDRRMDVNAVCPGRPQPQTYNLRDVTHRNPTAKRHSAPKPTFRALLIPEQGLDGELSC